MKKKLYYFLFLLISADLISSCSRDSVVEDLLVVEPVEQLVAPVDNITLELREGLSPTKFEWQRATASKGIAPEYEVLFFKENETPSNPVLKVEATTNNAIMINQSKLNEAAANAGIEVGASGVIKWTVRAYHESISAISGEINRIVVNRYEPVASITQLFLTGSGSEFGEDITDAMALTKISESEFVIFSKLTAGQPFRFINTNQGNRIRSFSVNEDKLVEDGTEAQVTKTGVYSIRIDLASESVSMQEVTDVSLFYSIKSRSMKLDYKGRGKWKGICLIFFTKQTWGDEKRYKFRMTEGEVDKYLEKADDSAFSMNEVVVTDPNASLWSGIWSYSTDLKDKWAEVIVDMSNYSHSITVVPEDFSGVGSSWATIAERSSADFLQGYWNTGTNHFNNSLAGKVNPNDYWPEAHAIDVVIDAYLRSNDNKYKQIIYDFYEGVKKKNHNTFKNNFYDDMAWHGLAHLRAFEATGDNRYEGSARDLYKWVLEGWDEAGKGIKQKNDPNSGIGVPSSGPAAIMAIRRWVKYGDSEVVEGLNDLQWAKKIYEGMREKKYDPSTGAVHDGAEDKTSVWSYNAGTFLGAAMELYDLTKEQHYMDDAIKTTDWSLENLSVKGETNRILSDWAEQQDNDVNLFKGIFIRYLTRLIMNPDLPVDKKNKYLQFIEYNAKTLMAYASATTDNNLLIYNYGWYFKPKDSFLRGQTSGCMLIEAVALLQKEGFL